MNHSREEERPRPQYVEEDADLKRFDMDEPDENNSNIAGPPKDAGCCGKIGYRLTHLIPSGSIFATICSTCATCVGGGILGIPSAFGSSGMIAAVMWLVAMGLACAYSLRLLAMAAERTGEKSYEQLAGVLLGKPGLYTVAAMRFINCVGSMTAYVVSVGNLMRPIVLYESDVFENSSYFRMVQAGLWLCFMFPVTLPRQFNQLRYVSTAGVTCMIFFSICVFAHFCANEKSKEYTYFGTGNTAISGMGVFMFAYVCQVNVVELYGEMKRPTVNRFTLCGCISASLIFTLYMMTGLFGYLEFGDNIGSSILLQYQPMEEPQILIAYCGVFVKLCASYGLFGNASRGAIYRAFNMEPVTVPFWKHFLITAALTLVTLLLGIFIPNVNTVFHFVGGLCGGFLSFILPSLFIMYCGNWSLGTVGLFQYVVVHLMLLMGIIGVVFGTCSTIYEAFE